MAGILDTTIRLGGDRAGDQVCKCQHDASGAEEAYDFPVDKLGITIKGKYTAKGREPPNLKQWVLMNLLVK